MSPTETKGEFVMAEWKCTGSYFETCSCDAACPCAFLSPPTKGYCTLLAGWHIEQGSYGDVALDGLNVAFAAHSPGHMMETKWKAALYLDERANDAQRDALSKIFKGEVGGQPARLFAHVGEFLGIKSVPIEYHTNATHRSLKIPQIADAEIENLSTEGAEEIIITSRPWSIAAGYPSVVAKSQRVEYNDYDMHWQMAKENAYHSPFEYHA
jgi:hypothetical protein